VNTGASVGEVATHRDRDSARDREHTPRTVAQRVDHDEGEHRAQDGHDRQNRDHRDRPRERPDLVPGHLAERLSVAAHGAEEDDEVLDGAREHHPEHDPEGAGQVAELGREHRTHQGSRAGDGRKVVPEEHPLGRGDEVPAVLQPLGRSRAAIVELEDPGGEEPTVESIADQVGTDGGQDQPRGADGFASMEGDDSPGTRAGNTKGQPGESLGTHVA
jgi:hypothetical protein